MQTLRTGSKGMPRQEREQWILTAAADEFGEATFAASSMNGIAARAGVSKALVLAYFGSKEDLYAACVERAGERLATAIGEALAGSPARAEMAEAVLTAIFTTLENQRSDWPVLYDRTVPSGRAREAARRQRTILRAQAAAAVTRTLGAVGLSDDDDLSAATLVWENMVSALVQWWRHHPERSADEMAGRARRVLLALSDRAVDEL
ncbi:HTH-type transcriptional regulator MtrR [Mycobacteroides salmoniphilum]|uniref:HTH-type transcriptional regulator MtrR n=2 Tax=Mycobacteroides salmoniphilum TaxID=404941 RepID=A0A4R8S5R3_9MYCO|nr:HTH-type transcriptional regulator MtrR [Mycobacteroides salmoniphilum]TDZ86197.1 HTH-type transcriptional regulator MtrR [Mycobacteroides salmoniphilum]TDZ86548.1 HTH-type transcriptional regulator MtrR [Mycobacteroides salmoniphilum]